MKAEKLNLGTLCVQGGWNPGNGDPRVLPIYQSTTFKYETSEQMAKLFDLEAEGYFYTRLQNPTNDAVAKKIADLEGGIGAVLTSSGQAANFFAMLNICEAGDHIVSSSNIYGGTFNLFGVTLKKMGIECTFVDSDAPEEEIAAAFRPNTKALFGESVSNPGGQVLDIEKFARVAHSHGVPLIVDNTFPTPINCRPFEWGADIVTHSTTKYMDGHATSVGGAVVDSGRFDWQAQAERFPGLTRPDASYHGLVYTEAFGQAAAGNFVPDVVGTDSSGVGSYVCRTVEPLHKGDGLICKFIEVIAVCNYVGCGSYPQNSGGSITHRIVLGGGFGHYAFDSVAVAHVALAVAQSCIPFAGETVAAIPVTERPYAAADYIVSLTHIGAVIVGYRLALEAPFLSGYRLHGNIVACFGNDTHAVEGGHYA